MRSKSMRLFVSALLIFCLTVTSFTAVAPQVYAETGSIESDQTEGGEITAPDDEEQPETPVIAEGWSNIDENGLTAEEKYYRDAALQVVKNQILLLPDKEALPDSETEPAQYVYSFDVNGLSTLYTGMWDNGTSVYSVTNGVASLYTGIWNNGSKVYTVKSGVKNLYTGMWENGTKVYKVTSGVASLYTGMWNNGSKVYTVKSGVKSLYTGIWKTGGKYYSVKKGVIDKSSVYSYNKKLYRNGSLYSGVYKSYYYKNGVKVTSYKKKVKKMNNGNFYYFTSNKKVYTGTGWKTIGGKKYYFKKGVACTGWTYIGGYKYYFHKSTASLCKDLIDCKGNSWKKKVTLIKVNRKKNCVTLYAKDGKNGDIIPVKAMACSVGKKATPTIKGTYTLKKSRTYRWAKLGGPTMGGYCYGQYCTRISGSYLFHSVTYRTKNKYTLYTSAYNNLGRAASHGCIRLQTGNAKIIYDIVRDHNVKVKIYDSNSVGPLPKPTVKKISSSKKYDPTDPTIKK